MKNRKLNEMKARLGGYFWLSCPLCGQMFGGHEWEDENTLIQTPTSGVGVCPDCKDKVKKINKDLKKVWDKNKSLYEKGI